MSNISTPLAPPDKYFYTVDGKILTNLYQLLDYIKSCSFEHYTHHVNMQRNDFANWLRHVFGLIELADAIQSSGNREGSLNVINKYFEDMKKPSNDVDIPLDVDKKSNSVKDDIKIVEKIALPENKSENKPENKPEQKQEISAVNPASQSENPDTLKFKEWSDEELEKFSKFGKPNRETESEDEKASYLKYELLELRNMIKELRKNEKNTLIADLMLRSVDSKISYYAITKKKEDYDGIIKIFNDVKRELDYCSQEQPYSFADEIIKGLELQKVTMKKT